MQIGNLYSQFSVQVFQLVDGTVHGDIQISRSDFSSGASDYLICAAEKWHSVISMPAGSGNVSINAVLDPADPTCSGTYVGPALTVGLYGQPNLTNGGERRSEKGSGQAWTDGASYKYNFQLDAFSESFTGTNGFASGTFEGTAQISRAYDRQRVDP
jgi:hypothetical protein